MIDAIILAGTTGCEKLAGDYKQYLELGGQTAVEHVVDAALECPDIRNVYIVGDTKRLVPLMEDRKVRIVQDYGTLVNNIALTFNQHVLRDSYGASFEGDLEKYLMSLTPQQRCQAVDQRVVILYSDAPFIRSEDISRFIATSDPFADYVVGFCESESAYYIEEQVGRPLFIPETKSDLFPFDDTNVRINNMLMGKPLRLPSAVWSLGQGVYNHRKLETEDGDENPHSWWNITKLFTNYALEKGNTWPVMKGFARGLFHFGAFFHSFLTGNIYARLFSTKQDFERVAFNLTGQKARGSINICDVAHPVLDVDNEEMYNRLKANAEELFFKIYNSKRIYELEDDGRTPEEALDDLVKNQPWLFEGKPEVGLKG